MAYYRSCENHKCMAPLSEPTLAEDCGDRQRCPKCGRVQSRARSDEEWLVLLDERLTALEARFSVEPTPPAPAMCYSAFSPRVTCKAVMGRAGNCNCVAPLCAQNKV